jgi:1,4-dihydroxy-2-naphthoate polyprenyltransferase
MPSSRIETRCGRLFFLEVATIFLNELFDWESDRRNRHAGPFTGGSRVLVDGRLTRWQLGIGTALALVASAALALGLPTADASSHGLLAILAVLALGYTTPPVKLSWRGLGELDVALTHSLLVILFGHGLQGGDLLDPVPWALSLPLFFAVLCAITLSGIPDYQADHSAGKQTLAVLLGPSAAARSLPCSAPTAPARPRSSASSAA